jgi:hypothetical protein
MKKKLSSMFTYFGAGICGQNFRVDAKQRFHAEAQFR